MKVAVNVKMQNVFRVICLEESEFTDQNAFIERVVEKFGISLQDEVVIELYNNKKAPIDFEIISTLISQYKGDSNFYVEVRIDGPQSFVSPSENLENYLRDHHCESILAEEKRNKHLVEESLEYLLNCVREYAHHEYSLNPTPDDIVVMCKALIALFPSLSSNDGDGIDNLYDRNNRTGMLYQKLRWKTRKTKVKQKRSLTAKDQIIIEEGDRKQIEELIRFFDSCVLPRDNDELLKKMKASAELRKKSNETNREIFDKCFHLYRLNPELVNEDFKLIFSQIDHSALTTKWADIEKKPVSLFKVALDRRINAFHRNEMVHGFLTYLKLFPVHKIGYDKAVNRLLVFSEDAKVDPQTLIRKDSDYPHIIGIYSNATKKFRFHIVVSKSLVNVPCDYNFLQVMDLYFKIHSIFCVPFEPSLAQFMAVIQRFVYGMECDVKLTPSTKNKAKLIFEELRNNNVQSEESQER